MEEANLRKSLESVTLRLNYHSKLREAHLEEKANTMKFHNDYVQRTKSDFDHKLRVDKDQDFMKNVQKLLKNEKSLKDLKADQDQDQYYLRTKNETRT